MKNLPESDEKIPQFQFRKNIESFSLQSYRDLTTKTMDKKWKSAIDMCDDEKDPEFINQDQFMESNYNLKGLLKKEEKPKKKQEFLQEFDNIQEKVQINEFLEGKASFSSEEIEKSLIQARNDF